MKVGIIGLGYRLGYLGHVLSAIDPDFSIVGYVDPAPAGLSILTERGIDPGLRHDTPEDLIRAGGFDLLMIGSPNHMHLDHIRLGLEAGVKVFSEKPVVSTLEQTFELAALLGRHGADRLLVGLVLRYAPMYRDLLAARDAGQLGDIVSIEAAEHIFPYHGAFFMRDWRRHEKWSGSFMLEKCCHDLDLYNGVIGARPLRVASFGGRKTFVPQNDPQAQGINDVALFHRKPSGWNGAEAVFDSDGDIIDWQVAIVEYANGVGMNFHTNLNAPDQFRRFAVFGTRGQAEGDFIRGDFAVHDVLSESRITHKTYPTRTELSQHYGADERMAAEIVAHVMQGGPLPVSPLDALEAGILAMAMDEARRSRTVVDLAPVWDRYDTAFHEKAA
ncbi:Gfo/Idh/MocA family protein [Falsirhodobacter halotolerans]|uniref:Gfo/Idh/MocA family protein n=1 Tax=Falsirhodobacter halotolerans TaxID=1146892 RepID=UPI001FD514BE|nr:Gfo/Idh/MocA family oxidoreductase [Falsirhodobacter halotolerans]MCJ8141262.1 Gfo/Idh/MocA family oxidoreductase [Falsirhodobacter halotolerans]